MQISLMFGFTEDSWSHTPASAVYPLPCVASVEVYEENLASHICTWKKEEYYSSLPDKCGYSSLMLYQNLTSAGFSGNDNRNLKPYQ